MVESEVATRLDLNWKRMPFDARLLIAPPLTLTASSLDLVFVAVVLTLLGILLFHEMAKNGAERWRSPTLPMIFCLLMVVTSIFVAMFLSVVD